MTSNKHNKALAFLLAIILVFTGGAVPALAKSQPAITAVTAAKEVAAGTASIPVTVTGSNFAANTQIQISWRIQGALTDAGSGIATVSAFGNTAAFNIPVGQNNTAANKIWVVTAKLGNVTKQTTVTQKASGGQMVPQSTGGIPIGPKSVPVIDGVTVGTPVVESNITTVNFTVNGSGFTSPAGFTVTCTGSTGGSGSVTSVDPSGSIATGSVSIPENATASSILWTIGVSITGEPSEKTAQFTQNAPAPQAPPSLTDISPNMDVEYENSTIVEITFSEAMAAAGGISITPADNGETAQAGVMNGTKLPVTVSNLKPGQTYTLTLTGFQSSAGVALPDNGNANTVSFATIAAPAQAPTIASSTPENDTTVSPGTDMLTINFDTAPTQKGTVTITGGGYSETPLMEKSGNGLTYTYTLPTLAYNTTYTLTVQDFENNGSKMNVETIQFSTEAAPSVTVTGTAPATGSTVPANTAKLTITFGADMNKNPSGTVKIKEANANNWTDLAIIDWNGTKTVEYNLTNLAAGKSYTVKIEGFTSAAGATVTPYTLSFATYPAPVLTSITPSGNNVSTSETTLKLQFDSDMDKGTMGEVKLGSTALTGGNWISNSAITYTLPSLEAGKVYNVSVKNFKSANGDVMADTSKSFTTAQTAVPSVSATAPANNATVAANTTVFSVSFNMDMNMTTGAMGTIKISQSQGSQTALTFSKWVNARTAEFRMPALASGKTYDVEITGFKSAAGQLMGVHTQKFHTSALPVVTNVTPSGDNVAVNTTILTIEFDRPMNKNVTGSVTVGGTALSSPYWVTDYKVQYALPVLSVNKTYNIVIDKFKDAAGNVMAKDSTRSFKTDTSTTTRPVVSSYTPYGNDVSIHTSKLTVTFNKPMNQSYGSVSVNKDISLSRMRWQDDYTIEYTMSSLNDYTDYTITIRNFRDTYGNTMDETTKTFRTEYRSGYWVTYHANGGSGSMRGNPYRVASGNNHTVEPNDFYRNQYEFVEWNTRSNGNGTSYYRSDTIRNIRDNVDLYAIWDYVGRDSNSSGGSLVSPPSNSSTVSSGTADRTIENQLDRGNNAALNLSSRADSVEISGRTINDVADSNKTLSISKDEMTVKMSPAFISSLNLSNSDDVEIDIKPTTASVGSSVTSVDSDNKQLAKMAFDASVIVNGSYRGEFNEGLEMTVDLKDLNLSNRQKDQLTGVRYNAGGKLDQLGGEWNGDKFTFRTSKLSKYGVLITDNITKIHMNVGSTSFSVNGASRRTDAAPVITNNRTMVPIRFVAESLGAEVGWHEGTRTVTIYLNGQTLSLTIGVMSSGMDVAPYIANERTYVPMRYIAEAFGANVVWRQADRSIEIVR